MKLYFVQLGFSTEQREILTKRGALNQLASFARIKDKHVKGYTTEKIFLDSGAFSAFTMGKKIKIQDYIDFIKRHKSKFEVYANLDVVGDAQATQDNQEIMEEAGLNPLPCFHYGEDLKYLRGYANKYDYIALGGLVPLSADRRTMKIWLNRCFSVLMPYIKSKKLKVHAFGVSNSEILLEYPFYSCDSSSWLAGAKFGRLVIYDEATHKMKDLGHYEDPETYKKHGLKLDYLKGYKEHTEHTIEQYQRMIADVTKIWRARGIDWG